MRKVLFVLWLLASGAFTCLGQEAELGELLARQRADATLNELPALIKTIDEPTLRVFLRLRLATVLWSGESRHQESRGHAETAEAMAVAALEDLRANAGDVPEQHANWLHTDLMALINARAPELAARLKEGKSSEKPGNQNQVDLAYSILNYQGDASAAVELMRGGLHSGADLNNVLPFFLRRLETEHPAELVKFLPELLAVEEGRAGSIPPETLIVLSHFYFLDGVPLDLKRRFLAVAVRSAGADDVWSDQRQLLHAYDLLQRIMPRVEKLAPAIYPQVMALAASLAARLQQQRLDRTGLENRIRQSSDPLEQLISEARARENAPIKDELLARAARLALDRGRLRQAMELVGETSSGRERNLWRDPFLGEVIDKALELKDPTSAASASDKIQTVRERTRGLLKIASYFWESGDTVGASEALSKVLKLMEVSENGAVKAQSLLEATKLAITVDKARVADVARSAVKSINDMPGAGGKDRESRRSYVDGLMRISSSVIATFRSLARHDEVLALDLADGFRSRDIKASALFGASVEILAAAKKTDSTRPSK